MGTPGDQALNLESAVRQLLHLEAIRLLRPRYCRFVDSKLWDDFEELFTPDFRAFSNNFVGRAPSVTPVATGPVEFRNRIEQITVGATTVHECFMPEIEITGTGTARGRWGMTDIVSHPTNSGMRFVGHGHYTDEYSLCADGEWRISKATLSRLRLDPLPLLEAEAVVGQPTGEAAAS